MCLGRHHSACWDEHRACASCAGANRLVPETTVWQRSDEDLYELIRQGRREEVEAYLDRCNAYTERVRERTLEVTAQLAFERMAEKLEQSLTLRRVVGPLPQPRAVRRREHSTIGLLALLMLGLAAAINPDLGGVILGLPLIFALGLKTGADRRDLLVPNLAVATLAVFVCWFGFQGAGLGPLAATCVGAIGLGMGWLGWRWNVDPAADPELELAPILVDAATEPEPQRSAKILA